MILLDDVQSNATNPSSRLYLGPYKHWAASTPAEIDASFAGIENAIKMGSYIVCLVAYEYGQRVHNLSPQPKTAEPLIQAWAFDTVSKLSKEEVDAWLQNQIKRLNSAEQIAGIAGLSESISEAQFQADVGRIQEWIRSGDTYQINHTYRVQGQSYGNPLALYARLRIRQPGRYGAFIQENETTILSQSPELLVERKGNRLRAMPMKGTASALKDSAESLSRDPKNRAENIMIVDLLRNDLSRIAEPGSVSVPALFDVTRHGDVLQMTSTVEATAKANLSLQELLNAVFPCGSVTGAPKKRSMELIQALEPSPRNYYCGAIGWLDPNGDFAFSVPIRTLDIKENIKTKKAQFTLGIGAGITIDSNAQHEWQECRIKSGFIRELPSPVGLFETMRVENGRPIRYAQHIARLQHSACALHIPFSQAHIDESVDRACSAISKSQTYRLRLNLSALGDVTSDIAALEPLTNPVGLFWAADILDNPKDAVMRSGNVLLGHKVTQREIYDSAWKIASERGGFDALFTNEAGLVSEGGRSSLFIQPKGADYWLTPPLSAGVLPGVMRATVLSDPSWNAREANLTIEDVLMASKLMVTNALRGPMPAHLKAG